MELSSTRIPSPSYTTTRSTLSRRVMGLLKRKNTSLLVAEPDSTCSRDRSLIDPFNPETRTSSILRPTTLTRTRRFFNRRRSTQRICGVTKVTSVYQLREPLEADLPPQYSILGLSDYPEIYVPHGPQSSQILVPTRDLDGSGALVLDMTVHDLASRAMTSTSTEFLVNEQRFPVLPFSFLDSDHDIAHAPRSRCPVADSSSSSDNSSPINLQTPSDFILEEAESSSLAISVHRENTRRVEQNRIAEIRAEVSVSLAYAMEVQMQNGLVC